MNVVIGVPTGLLRCSHPAPEKPLRLRNCVRAEPHETEITSSIVVQVLRGYIPESIKRLGARVMSVLVIPRREPSRSCFVFWEV